MKNLITLIEKLVFEDSKITRWIEVIILSASLIYFIGRSVYSIYERWLN